MYKNRKLAPWSFNEPKPKLHLVLADTRGGARIFSSKFSTENEIQFADTIVTPVWIARVICSRSRKLFYWSLSIFKQPNYVFILKPIFSYADSLKLSSCTLERTLLLVGWNWFKKTEKKRFFNFLCSKQFNFITESYQATERFSFWSHFDKRSKRILKISFQRQFSVAKLMAN